ncbi:DUF192 domain-containing protein [Candidatus Woesearchaeota archaeon]|nr:DUF192 domain-containing protein [Candidatus Woesearchaeota archaeon]
MEYKIINSKLGKARGLMFSKKKNLMFVFDKEQKVPLHNFFVFFSIDVLFLDKDKKIVEIKKDFKPFSYYNPKKKAKYVLEIAVNEDKKEHKIGEKFI